jgi:hypothetical protein
MWTALLAFEGSEEKFVPISNRRTTGAAWDVTDVCDFCLYLVHDCLFVEPKLAFFAASLRTEGRWLGRNFGINSGGDQTAHFQQRVQ